MMLRSCLCAAMVLAGVGNASAQGIRLVEQREALAWDAANESQRTEFVRPRAAQHALLDVEAFAASLDAGEIDLPLPDGRLVRCRMVEAPVMEPGLAARFPQMRAYSGVGIDDPAVSVRLDVTNHGVRGFVRTSEGFAAIDPWRAGSREHIVSYWFKDSTARDYAWACGTSEADAEPAEPTSGEGFETRGTLEVRVYRLAIACTGEYGAYQSSVLGNAPNLADTMSALVTITNRTNATFEPDLGVRFVMVAANDQLAFFDPLTDPYPDVSCPTPASDCSSPYYSVNQGIVDGIIGNANYDVGHVVTRLPGGVASLRSVCRSTRKALGVSGIPRGGENEPVSALVVLHELGHQFGANHTYNGLLGRCGPNVSGNTAWEPGGGSTIMSYPGACPVGGGLTGDNLVIFADAYFHAGSLLEMRTYLATANSMCHVVAPTNNTLPVFSDITPSGEFVPPRTPFRLSCAISDSSTGQTFAWDQLDRGPQQSLEGPGSEDNGFSPLFRSLPPTISPSRTFPNWDSVFAGSDNRGERYPHVEGSVRTFRVTVRDNVPGESGSVTSGLVTLTIGAGPALTVTAQQFGFVSSGVGTVNVSWPEHIANAPYNDTQVRISYAPSEDGPWQIAGLFPAAAGIAQISVSTNATTTARVMVEPAEGIYFNVSPAFSMLEACDTQDFNNDGLFPDDQDLVDLLSVMAGGPCSRDPLCNDIDYNNDGLFPDDADLISYLRVLAGGPC